VFLSGLGSLKGVIVVRSRKFNGRRVKRGRGRF
jgi:hypothetical protein